MKRKYGPCILSGKAARQAHLYRLSAALLDRVITDPEHSYWHERDRRWHHDYMHITVLLSPDRGTVTEIRVNSLA